MLQNEEAFEDGMNEKIVETEDAVKHGIEKPGVQTLMVKPIIVSELELKLLSSKYFIGAGAKAFQLPFNFAEQERGAFGL